MALLLGGLLLGGGSGVAGWPKSWCQRCRERGRPDEDIPRSGPLPNHGFAPTRWTRWPEPYGCGESYDAYAPEPWVQPARPYVPPADTVPRGRYNEPNSFESERSPAPFPPAEPSPRSIDDEWSPVPSRRPEPPAPTDGPGLLPEETAPAPRGPRFEAEPARYETEEWSPDPIGEDRLVPRYGATDPSTRRLSFESTRRPAGAPLELPEIAVPRDERPVDAVLRGDHVTEDVWQPNVNGPALLPPGQIRPIGHAVGRPGPNGYYRHVSQPLGPQPPRTPSERIVR